MNTQLMNAGLQTTSSMTNPNATKTTTPSTTTSTELDTTTSESIPEGGVTNTSGEEWRNKENDRAARQQIARIILTLIMKSTNKPAANNYNPREIARRLEHTLYMNSASKEEYSNLSTLKLRLQRALDNSRRRQQLQQMQANAATTAGTDTSNTTPATPHTGVSTSTTSTAASSIQAQTVNTAANVPGTATGTVSKPTPTSTPAAAPPTTSAQAAQAAQIIAAQTQLQLQQAQFQAQLQNLSKAQNSITSATPATQVQSTVTAPTPSAVSTSNSTNILEELEREADEMASGISDQPLEMPTSELEASVASTSSNNLPLNMPMNMAMPMGMMQNRVPYGMNLNLLNVNASTPYVHQQLQLQQIQQMHLQQLQLQKLQQLQHQMQLNAAAKLNATNSTAAAPATAAVTSTPNTNTTSNTTTPNAMPEVTPKQRREEFRKRLIQLKHARTCQNNPCEEGFCAKVKVLLTHVSNCSDAECTTIGCKSTRQLLSHYRKCRDMQCYVCSAIRTQNPVNQAVVLRRQQDRLCMLRHASTCNLTPCPMQYCADMKVLWAHICGCRQSQCPTDHCISSRYVLSHFKQCQKPDCGVCVPVRHAIKIIDSTKANPQDLNVLAQNCSNEVKILIRQMTTVPIAMPIHSSVPSTNEPIDTKPTNLVTQTTLKQQIPAPAPVVPTPPSKLPAKPKPKPKIPTPGIITPTIQMTPTVKPSGIKSESKSTIKKETFQPSTGQININQIKKNPTDKEKKEIRKLKAEKAKERQQIKMQGIKPSTTTTIPLGGMIKMEPEFKMPIIIPTNSPRNNLNNEQDISYLDSMTEAQLEEHIKSLRFNFCGHISLIELKNRLLPLLIKLMETEHGWAFNSPVDPIQWNIPDYLDVIKCPMDLGTIKKRLEAEHYVSVDSFASDVRLTFENCISYNSSTNKFNIAAKELLKKFEIYLIELKKEFEIELKNRCEERREEMCQLCGGDSFKFAPSMLFCSGPCSGRIRRHTHYYSDPRSEYHWCSNCYKQMKDGILDISLLPNGNHDIILNKSQLLKKKNSEVAEEPWVECDTCKLWYHQICGLFNERNHAISGEQEQFVCPFCTIKQRQNGIKPTFKFPLQAKRLPITRMAARIEKRVIDALAKAHEDEIIRLNSLGNIEMNIHSKNKISIPSFAITIREVLSVEKQVQIKEKMLKQFDLNDIKMELKYRSRCICVFQELDGVDILIFTLYVQEYGNNCNEPNRGRVYISYLDSVAYFQPKKFRVLMHQQVILGFLEDAKIRGYHTAHIWSCPPLKGDDYIFFCKPENQKIPKAARLRSWYSKLLQGAKKEGLVYTISNLYAEYYLKKKTANELPYFEGDYWPRLAEDLIKQIEEKPYLNRKLNDDIKKIKNEINNDPIMQKLKTILEPQKEDFFVVDLHPRCHKCLISIIDLPYWTLKTLNPILNGINEIIEQLKKAKMNGIKTSMYPRHYQHYYCQTCYELTKNNIQLRIDASIIGAKKAKNIYEMVEKSNDPSTFQYSGHDIQDVKYELSLTYSKSSLYLDEKNKINLEPDQDELMPCEIFDTREAFLMYCQNNHCQFDQIRRSKHSSMMVLYHLFNQGTTGFTFSCCKCNIILTSGKRWNCSICLNFNLCENCRIKIKHQHPLHPFQIISIPQPKHIKTSAEIDQYNMEINNIENKKNNIKKRNGSKKEKLIIKKNKIDTIEENSIIPTTNQQRIHNVDPQLLVQLEHASICKLNDSCTYINCNRMRAMLKHGATCEARKIGPCQLCKRIVGLLSAHAKQCTKSIQECHVPRCTEIRRLVQLQQTKQT